MAEGDEGRRAVGEDDIAHEAAQVAVIFRERMDMALTRVADRAGGTALPAPIHDRHREAAPAQVTDRLEIFLDELRSPLEDADRAAARTTCRLPQRKTQLMAIIALERTRLRAGRNRIAGERYQLHRHAFGRPGRLAVPVSIASGIASHLLNPLDP